MRRRFLVVPIAAALLGVSLPSALPESGTPLVVGIWPQSYAQFLEIESASGVSLPYYRGRQRDGQFDSLLVPPDAAAAAAAGYSIGMNIQPKTGSGQSRTGIAYTDITAQLRAGSGPYYEKLVSFADEVLALPTYGEVTHYLQFHSEANLQAPPGELDAQPYSGTGPEYQECFALVRELFDAMGVTDHIVWQVVLTRSAYVGKQGGPTSWFPADTSLYDLVGVDSYHRPETWLTPQESFDAAIAFADSVGKDVWIDETGSDEGGPLGSPTAKAEWFAALGDYLQGHAGDIVGVVFSHASDGGDWYLDSVLSGGRSTVNYSGTTWEGWLTLAARLAPGPPPPPPPPPPPVTHTLSVSTAGAGTGSVASDVGGIDCGPTCIATVDHDSQVTLIATPAEGSVFEGWSGDGLGCAGPGPCTVTVTADTSILATFAPTATLSVSLTGDGGGSVASEPAGIDCGVTCSASFTHGTVVTLTPTPDADMVFAGWSGACSGTDACVVTMDGATAVGATFAPVQRTLVVTTDGGSGTVTSQPAGIDCGSTCEASFDHGTQVGLTASPAAGMVFRGWSGACTGSGDCLVSMTADAAVTATFEAAPTSSTLADSDPAVSYDGWRGVTDPAASGGTYRINTTKGQVLDWVSPATTSITWVARTGPDLGKAGVTIDGVGKGTVDLYAAVPGSLSRTYSGLSNAAHSVQVKVLGTKSTASAGTAVTHDAFVVGATTTEESAPSVRYVKWAGTTQAAATDGSYRSTTTKGATATVTFSGTGIEWIAATGRSYGKASVTIDGVSTGTVDLFAPSTAWQVVRGYGGLAPGPHTLVIKVLGTKNASATGTAVIVDGFVVHP